MLLATVVPAAASAGRDLRVAVTPVATAPAGGSAPVTVSWRNAGPAAARSVTVVYVPPTGTALATTQPAGWRVSGRRAVRTVASLAAGGAGSAAVRITVPRTAVPGGVLVGGFAQIGAPGAESVPANNEAASRVRVAAAATPKPSRTPSPTRSITASPVRVAARSTSPAPAAVASPAVRVSIRPTASPTRAVVATPRRSPARVPTPARSTYVVTVRASPGATAIRVIDDRPPWAGVAFGPLAGAAACFSLAGTGLVLLRRRRRDAQSDAEEWGYTDG